MRLAFLKTGPKAPLWVKAIAWWTKGPYAHSELWMSGPAEAAECYSSDPDKGTRTEVRNLSGGNWDFIEMPPQYTEAQAKNVIQRIGHHEYDIPGIVGFVFPPARRLHYGEFCSESDADVAEALHALPTENAPAPAWDICPNELAQWAAKEWGVQPRHIA